jgi:hypothetical protein
MKMMAPGPIRLPSLFNKHQHDTISPRFVCMSDVLNCVNMNSLASENMTPFTVRLPSIGAMIHRDLSPREGPVVLPSISPSDKRSDLTSKYISRHSPKEFPVSPLSLKHSAPYSPSQPRAVSPDSPAALLCSLSVEKSASNINKRSNNAKLCGKDECKKRAKAGGFCIAHGGGLRCSEAGCQKHAVSLGLCISHGGGKRCTVEGCLNASRKNGVCWSHGGKRLCKLEGCTKGPKSGGYCWSHGGKMKK